MPSSQREIALDITRQLRGAGFEALWAGGCVRDQLLGREPKDYDVATNARPEQIQQLFGKRRTLAIGAAFGVIGVLSKNCDPVEVATFRSDGAYLDGRHPSSIVFTTAEHDAQRRDFTINGMFFDPLADQVIDYVGGQADLASKTIRAIGDPAARFTEDKLRMLRAVRFATTFGFEIEPATFRAIQDMAEEVGVVSAERIGAEFTLLLTHPRRARGVRLLSESGLLRTLLIEVDRYAAVSAEAWQSTLRRLDQLDSTCLATAFAALLFENISVNEVSDISRRFRFSNKEIEGSSWLLNQLPRIAEADTLAWPQLQRILIHDGATELLALAETVLGHDSPGLIVAKQASQLPAEKLNPAPLVTGDDLVRKGFQPGPQFSRLLTSLRDAQLLGQITTPAEALALARTLFDEFEIE